MRILDEDLHWLYWGSEEEEIISKLLNEKNDLIKFIESLSTNSFYNHDIAKILTMFLTHLRNKEVTHESALITSHMNEGQIKRLWQLDHKYGLLYNYDYEENMKQLKIQQEHDTKINVIKTVLNLKGLVPFDITSRNREVDSFNFKSLANKMRDQRESYRLYCQKLEPWNYSHTWQEFDKLVNELLDIGAYKDDNKELRETN
jgi:UDP-N-acetylglucosamine transferase subunit ALG13